MQSSASRMMRLFTPLALCLSVNAQSVIPVGSGSYAAYPQSSAVLKDWNGNVIRSYADYAQNPNINVLPSENRPIPTNKWWTDLIAAPLGSQLWAYPLMSQPQADGLHVFFPKKNVVTPGRVYMDEGSYISVGGQNATFTGNTVLDWSDWGVKDRMNAAAGSLDFNTAHGMPFVWMTANSLTPELKGQNGVSFLDKNGNPISSFPYTSDRIVLSSGGSYYGVHLPAPAQFNYGGYQYIQVDLGSVQSIDTLAVNWETACAKVFLMQFSTDGVNWTTAKQVTNFDSSQANTEVAYPVTGSARFVRLTCVESATQWPYSIWEFKVLKNGVNLAQNKTYSTSTGDASAAFDGNNGTRWIGSNAAGGLTITMPAGSNRFVISALNAPSEIDAMHDYAMVEPLSTEVDWAYDPNQGKVSATWNYTTQDLSGRGRNTVLQYFLPHQYKRTLSAPSFEAGKDLLSPEGVMKQAVGSSFTFSYFFKGMVPTFGEPAELTNRANPYHHALMDSWMNANLSKINFGDDTYWGGKDLVLGAKYALMAKAMGNESADPLLDRLKSAFANWLTYTPGENAKYFAYYPRWKAMIGFNDAYGSAEFTDNHFHYGYFTHGFALLAMADPDFANRYADMIKMVAKQYANWDRRDDQFPVMRTMDVWLGHSHAGGMSSSTGNNQESSSESMQAWMGIFLLGNVLGDNEMRDAGAFGYLTEARATMQYWMNADGDFFPAGYNHNLTGMMWASGTNYGTYFGDNPWYIAGIQWLPVAPGFDYLTEDFSVAKGQKYYNDLMTESITWNRDINIPRIQGWIAEQTAKGEDHTANDGALAEAQAVNARGYYEESQFGDWGHVLLGYRQLFDPTFVTGLLDTYRTSSDPVKQAFFNTNLNNGLTYWYAHNSDQLGMASRARYTNIPTSTAYYSATAGWTYVVYNPSASQQTCNVYASNDHSLIGSFPVPPRTTVHHHLDQALSKIVLGTPSGAKTLPQGSTTQLTATGYDQYGATFPLNALTWSVTPSSESISATGVFTANVNADPVVVTARQGSVSTNLTLRVAPTPVLSSIQVTPAAPRVESGEAVPLVAKGFDQYGDAYPLPSATWTLSGPGTLDASSHIFTAAGTGVSTVTVSLGGISTTATIECAGTLTNLAQGKVATASDSLGANTAANAVDGIGSTRWESPFADPQWISVDLGAVYDLKRVGITWEGAFATNYQIQYKLNASDDWSVATTVKNGTAGLVSTTLAEQPARYVRIYGVNRATAYGYSIYELAVYGFPHRASGVETLLSQNKPIVATSFEHAGTPVAAANDGDLGTRWSSSFAENQSITVDLGAAFPLTKAVLNWEAAYASSYRIDVSNDNVTFTPAKTISGNTGGANTVSLTGSTGRYVRVQGLTRATPWGISLWEFQVYGLK